MPWFILDESKTGPHIAEFMNCITKFTNVIQCNIWCTQAVGNIISDLVEVSFCIWRNDDFKGVHLLQAPFQIIKYIIHSSALLCNGLPIAVLKLSVQFRIRHAIDGYRLGRYRQRKRNTMPINNLPIKRIDYDRNRNT